MEVWQIGNEGGLLAAPVNLTAVNGNKILMGPAERADVIVDFTNVPLGNHGLGNVGPDGPFAGVGIDPPADPDRTGQIMQFRVVAAVVADSTTPPQFLVLPAITPLPAPTVTRNLALLEELSQFFADAPAELRLGTVTGDPNTGTGTWTALKWADPVTENPVVGATEVWEMYNATVDAHPMHIHEVAFQVVTGRRSSWTRRIRPLMLAAGNELGHTQHGNNNAYCQDNAIAWIDWLAADQLLTAFTARLTALRRELPALRQSRWLSDHSARRWPA